MSDKHILSSGYEYSVQILLVLVHTTLRARRRCDRVGAIPLLRVWVRVSRGFFDPRDKTPPPTGGYQTHPFSTSSSNHHAPAKDTVSDSTSGCFPKLIVSPVTLNYDGHLHARPAWPRQGLAASSTRWGYGAALVGITEFVVSKNPQWDLV